LERVASSFPRSGSASVVLISNISMLTDHKRRASGAFRSTRWSTRAGQRSEVHELRRSQRAPQWQGNGAGPDAVGKACRGTAIQLQISRAAVQGPARRGDAWGLLLLFIFPIARPVKGAPPGMSPLCATKRRCLMGAQKIRLVISFGPKVRDAMSHPYGPRHPIQCPWAEVRRSMSPGLGSRFRVAGSGSVDLGTWFRLLKADLAGSSRSTVAHGSVLDDNFNLNRVSHQ
jgi:hypothetical protein